MSYLTFLNTKEYQVYNRTLAHELGIHAAIFLGELINRMEYHTKTREILEHDGKEWFYYTHDKGIERMAMSRKEQDSALNILIKAGLVEKVVKGVPARRYFRIVEEEVLKIFGLELPKKDEEKEDSGQTSLSESGKLDCPQRSNWIDPNGQTGPIYKNPKKNPSKEYAQTEKNRSSQQSVDFYFSHENRTFIGISESDINSWKEAYPYAEINKELRKAEQWLLSNPSKAKKKNWRKFITSWLSRISDTNENKAAYRNNFSPEGKQTSKLRKFEQRSNKDVYQPNCVEV